MGAANVKQDLWAAANLDGLKERISMDKQGHAVEERFKDGLGMCRLAGRIVFLPERGVYELRLYKGASSADLRTLRDYVSNLKRVGLDDNWYSDVWESDGARYYTYAPYLYDQRKPDHYDELKSCADRSCIETIHEFSLASGEQMDPCRADGATTDEYDISVMNHREGAGWEVEGDLDGFYPKDVAELKVLDRFRNDFLYLQGEVDRLNALAEEAAA